MQRSGFMIRDFTLVSSSGNNVRISDFRGRSNLVVVFTGSPSFPDAIRGFLTDAERSAQEFSKQDATLVAILPCGPEEHASQIADGSPILVLYDKTHAAYRRSGATDENGRVMPLVYLTDRFGEIVCAFAGPGHSTPPAVDKILSALEFVNQQCPECEPPEWPR